MYLLFSHAISGKFKKGGSEVGIDRSQNCGAQKKKTCQLMTLCMNNKGKKNITT